MLPSLSAGTFECGRPQIVFECNWCAIAVDQNFARRSKFRVCVRKPRSRQRLRSERSYSLISACSIPVSRLTYLGRHFDDHCDGHAKANQAQRN